MEKNKYFKLPKNDGSCDIVVPPKNFESFIDIIKNKYNIENIKDYQINVANTDKKNNNKNYEINNKNYYDLISKSDKTYIKISINKIVKEIDNLKRNLNNNPKNKDEDNINKNDINNESNTTTQTTTKEKEEKSKINISLDEIIKQLKYLDEESLDILLEATQEEIIERKINNMKEKY